MKNGSMRDNNIVRYTLFKLKKINMKFVGFKLRGVCGYYRRSTMVALTELSKI